jgi:hypothetical protein
VLHGSGSNRNCHWYANGDLQQTSGFFDWVIKNKNKEEVVDFATKTITVIYLALVAYISVILVWNFVKTKNWEKEILYLIVLIPFLLRLFWLK